MSGLLVADSGPLIALARLELLREARSCFHDFLVPEIVYSEITRKQGLADAQILKTAASSGIFSVVSKMPSTLETVEAYGLDPGETMAIALALHELSVVLIDERKGRIVARSLGLEIIGTLGMLALLREKGLIDSVASPIAKLMVKGYYLPEILVDRMLSHFGEKRQP